MTKRTVIIISNASDLKGLEKDIELTKNVLPNTINEFWICDDCGKIFYSKKDSDKHILDKIYVKKSD